MSHKTIPIQLGGRQYNLRFGAMGAYLLQRELNVPLQDFAGLVDLKKLGLMELHVLLYAELESTRQADHAPGIPWTIASVAQLIDNECGGDIIAFWQAFSKPVMEAFSLSFHATIKQQEEIQRRQAESQDDSADPPAGAASTGDSSATGTTASTSPRRSGSRRTSSGA